MNQTRPHNLTSHLLSLINIDQIFMRGKAIAFTLSVVASTREKEKDDQGNC